MKKIIIVIVSVLVVGLLGFITWSQIQSSSGKPNYSKYDFNTVIGPNDDNGNIGDHVKGNANAKVLIFEYADYQCSGCAGVRGFVDEVLKKYGDKIGIVQRSYVLSYHNNGVAAAAAAEAAGLQGYWAPYGELLFANQNDWFSSDVTERKAQFLSYFKTVTNDKGDVDKFLADMESDAIKKKVDFDMGIGKRVGDIAYTPAFFIDGKFIDWANNTEGKAEIVNADGAGFVDFFSKIIDERLAN